MAKLGMDVDAIRALAGRLDAEAQRIQGVIGAVDALVRRISGDWHGHNAQRFVGDWHRSFRPSLQRAHDSVTGLATSARNNAAAQETVSGVAGGDASARLLGGGGETNAGHADITSAELFGWLFAGGALASGWSKIIGANHQVAEWAKEFKAIGLTSWGNGIRSVLQKEGHGIGYVVSASHLSPRSIADLRNMGKFIAGSGKVLNAAGSGIDGVHSVYAFAHHDVGGGLGYGADVTADFLQTKGTIGFLAGVDVRLWKDVIELGAHQQLRDWTDWGWVTHTSLKDWGYILSNTAADTGRQLVGHLWKDLL